MSIDPNAPAHPTYATGMMGQGLTIRAYFAAMAMQGIVSSPSVLGAMKAMLIKEADDTEDLGTLTAKSAVEFADALIAELNK